MKDYGIELFLLINKDGEGFIHPIDVNDKDLAEYCEYYNKKIAQRLKKWEHEFKIRKAMGEFDDIIECSEDDVCDDEEDYEDYYDNKDYD